MTTIMLMLGNDASGALTLLIAPLLAAGVPVFLAPFVYRRSGVKPRTVLVSLLAVAVSILTEVATIGVALIRGGV